LSLLAGSIALSCYLLLVRGLVMLRSVPRYLLDDTADIDVEEARQSPVTWLYGVLGRWAGPATAELLGPKWRSWVQGMLAAAGQPRDLQVQGFAELQGA